MKPLSLLFRRDSFLRLGRFSSPLISVSQFQQMYSSVSFFIFAIPFNFLSLFFLSYKIYMEAWPFHSSAFSIQFSDTLSFFKLGKAILVSYLILFPEMFRNCKLRSFYSEVKTVRSGIWFFEALRVWRQRKSAATEISAIEFVLRSKCWIQLNLRINGKILSSSFSAKFIFTKATVLLSAVFPNPLTEPLTAYYNFFISSSILSLASSSNLFLSYSCCFRSSSLCLSSS